RVVDLFNQTSPKCRRGNPEDEIAGCRSGIEVRLVDIAACRVYPARDGEQVMDAAVRFESRFSHRPVQRDKEGDRVRGAIQRGNRDLRICRRTGAADRWLRVTADTTV